MPAVFVVVMAQAVVVAEEAASLIAPRAAETTVAEVNAVHVLAARLLSAPIHILFVDACSML